MIFTDSSAKLSDAASKSNYQVFGIYLFWNNHIKGKYFGKSKNPGPIQKCKLFWFAWDKIKVYQGSEEIYYF